MAARENPSPETLRKALSEHGLRATPQRLAVLEAVSRMKSHPTTEQVYQSLKVRYPTLSFDTVNRTLLTLMDLGLIGLAESYGAERRFEPDLSPHHHLHCIRCGRIIDIAEQRYNDIRLPDGLRNQDFIPLGVRVSVYGYCGLCARTTSETPDGNGS